MADSKDLSIVQGKTFSQVLRWETAPIVYKAITAITQTAPVRLTVIGHGLSDGWRCAVTNVKGMLEINAQANNVRARDYHPVTVIDTATIELNDINAAGFKPYVSGGYIQYNSPVDLTGYTARMKIKDKVGGTVLDTLDTTNGKIVVDPAGKTITLKLDAATTAAYAWTRGVYELEMVSATGEVTTLLRGTITVTKEVTT